LLYACRLRSSRFLKMRLNHGMKRNSNLNFVQNSSWSFFSYRDLIASSESDWNGDGKHITKEVYLEDGSIVYFYDLDGSGELNYSETGNQK